MCLSLSHIYILKDMIGWGTCSCIDRLAEDITSNFRVVEWKTGYLCIAEITLKADDCHLTGKSYWIQEKTVHV